MAKNKSNKVKESPLPLVTKEETNPVVDETITENDMDADFEASCTISDAILDHCYTKDPHIVLDALKLATATYIANHIDLPAKDILELSESYLNETRECIHEFIKNNDEEIDAAESAVTVDQTLKEQTDPKQLN